jgi:PAS domain S-box-containing protein
MSEVLNLLIVEDCEDDALLTVLALRRDGFQPVWERVQTAEALGQALDQQSWHLIISDYQMPGFNAPAALEIVRSRGLDIPFIVVSGTIGDAAAVELMRAGAQDYLMKDNLLRLPEAVRRELREAQIRSSRRRTEAELAGMRERLHLAVDGAGIGIWDWNVKSGEVQVSDRCAELLGYSPTDFSDRQLETWRQLIHADDLSKMLEVLDHHFCGESPIYECEFRLRHRSGHWVWVLDRGKVVEWDATGQPLRMTGTFLDISDRKQAELRLEIQNTILERIAKHDPLSEILEALVLATESQLDGGICSILLCNGTGRLHYGAAPHLPPAYNQAVDGVQIGPDVGSCGRAAFCREVVIVSDIANDPLWRNFKDLALEHDLRSCWSAPAIGSDDEVLATFGVYYHDCRRPQPQDLETILLATNIAKIAIERHRANETLAQMNRELEERVEQRTAALQESETKLQAILNFAPAAIYVKDLAGRYTFVNQAFLTLFDCQPADIVGKTNQEFFAATVAEQLDQHDATVIATRQFQQVEEEICIGDTVHTFLSNKFVLLDRHGEPYALCGISTDISDRQRFQKTLKLSEERTRATLRAIPDLVMRLTREGIYQDIMPTPEVKSLSDPAQSIGRSINEVKPKHLLANYHQAIQQALATRTVQGFEQQIWIDNELQYEEVRVAPCGDDEVVVLIRDITDRKRAEAALKRSEARFQRLASNVPGALYQYVLRTDGNHEFVYMSDRCQAIYEVDADTILQNPNLAFEMVIPEDQASLHTSIAQSAQTLEQWSWEGRLLTPSGQHRWIQGISQPERLANGNIVWDGLVIDISDRKLIEAQLQQTIAELARATRLKDEFLANMSHELRTPLNAILGMSEGLQEDVFGPIAESQRQAIATIERSGKHLLELINDILDLSKIEAGKLELNYQDVSIRALCETSLTFVKQLAQHKQLALTLDIDSNLNNVTIYVDDRRICQVLINLLSNAVKFTPNGGRVSLRAYLEIADEPAPPGVEGPDPLCYICFAVTDTGIGIAAADLDKLFNSFVQIDSSLNRQYAGTGLGLALVKQITEMHGGHVSVTSQPHQGSCFMVCLPCHEQLRVHASPSLQSGAALAKPSITEGSKSLEPPLVLLVEDNAANVMTTSNYLQAKGYRLAIAHDGQQGVNMAQSLTPDVILMDIQMPGMDGVEAMQMIRRQTHLTRTPIIALTALAMPGDREACLQAGATEYLTKPVKLKTLVATIQQLLAAQPSSAS